MSVNVRLLHIWLPSQTSGDQNEKAVRVQKLCEVLSFTFILEKKWNHWRTLNLKGSFSEQQEVWTGGGQKKEVWNQGGRDYVTNDYHNLEEAVSDMNIVARGQREGQVHFSL